MLAGHHQTISITNSESVNNHRIMVGSIFPRIMAGSIFPMCDDANGGVNRRSLLPLKQFYYILPLIQTKYIGNTMKLHITWKIKTQQNSMH